MKLDGMSIQEIKKVYKRAVREHGIPNQYRRKVYLLLFIISLDFFYRYFSLSISFGLFLVAL